MKEKYSHIIWDWNGTLLDDVDWCIEQMNIMLKKRDKEIIKNIEEYHKAFDFPIINYYKNIGFDFEEESFETLAKEYIDLYHGEGSENLRLHNGVEKFLKITMEKEISQIILSASAEENLNQQINLFNIKVYFKGIYGIKNIYAKSKIEIGIDYMKNNKVEKGIVIGDTVHDYEVSRALGLDCILFSKGHQNKEKLQNCLVPIFDNYNDIIDYIF